MIPSLLEEVVWRVVLQPPGMVWGRIVVVNAAFSLYHIVGSSPLAELEGKIGAKTIFCDPMFLSLAFVLGNACSFAYIRSGHSLWAPVLVHALSVTVWLSFLGGQSALVTKGGLASRDDGKGKNM
jgi:predicted Abi (CAAX) family protease